MVLSLHLLPDPSSNLVHLVGADGSLSLLRAMQPLAMPSLTAGAFASIPGHTGWQEHSLVLGIWYTNMQWALTCWISVSTIL